MQSRAEINYVSYLTAIYLLRYEYMVSVGSIKILNKVNYCLSNTRNFILLPRTRRATCCVRPNWLSWVARSIRYTVYSRYMSMVISYTYRSQRFLTQPTTYLLVVKYQSRLRVRLRLRLRPLTLVSKNSFHGVSVRWFVNMGCFQSCFLKLPLRGVCFFLSAFRRRCESVCVYVCGASQPCRWTCFLSPSLLRHSLYSTI